MNEMTVRAFARGSLTPILDGANDFVLAQGVEFETFFPGGLYGAGSFFVPKQYEHTWLLREGQRIEIYNDGLPVYEGEVSQISYVLGGPGQGGRRVQCIGMWDAILGRQGWRKAWADTRITQDVWEYSTNDPGSEKMTVDRTGRIRFTPKGVLCNNGDFAEVLYAAPIGETVKRVTLNYDMQEGGQQWQWTLYNSAGAANVWAITVSGTGSRDDTLGTPTNLLSLFLYSAAGQTPTEDGAYYGQVTSLVVYSETGNINGYEIALDILGRCTDLNSDTNFISNALTLSLVPFITEPNLAWEKYASILSRAVGFGDASFSQWYARLLGNWRATTPNGEPVLQLAQYPALTDYDVVVRADDVNVEPFQLVRDGSGIINYVILKYTDAEGKERWLTPDDDANLTDTTSVGLYGRREPPQPIDCGRVSSTVATNYGRRILAVAKDPKFYVSGPITVRGFIRTKSGALLDASEITAGMRLKIEDVPTDEVGVANAGLTFHVSHTKFDSVSQSCQISAGVPDDLAFLLAKVMAGVD